MKFGIKLPNSGPFATGAYLRRAVLTCEELGYDSVWAHDHLHRSRDDAINHHVGGSPKAWDAWPGDIEPNVYEPLSLLGYAAAITTRIRLVVGIVVLPLRNPVQLAKEAACIDQLSGGRLTLGVGTGGSPYIKRELDAVGAPHLLAGRGRLMDEWIDVMRGVWRDPVFNHEGEFITVRGAEVYPKPLNGTIPLVAGGSGPRTIGRVASKLDGWSGPPGGPEAVRTALEDLWSKAEAFSRGPAEIEIITEKFFSIGRNSAAARRRGQGAYDTLMRYIRSISTAPDIPIDDSIAANLFGSPEDVLREVEAYAEAGLDHLVLRVIADSFDQWVESLQLFKDEVIDRARVPA